MRMVVLESTVLIQILDINWHVLPRTRSVSSRLRGKGFLKPALLLDRGC
jgi:hypothetical protein